MKELVSELVGEIREEVKLFSETQMLSKMDDAEQVGIKHEDQPGGAI